MGSTGGEDGQGDHAALTLGAMARPLLCKSGPERTKLFAGVDIRKCGQGCRVWGLCRKQQQGPLQGGNLRLSVNGTLYQLDYSLEAMIFPRVRQVRVVGAPKRHGTGTAVPVIGHHT